MYAVVTGVMDLLSHDALRNFNLNNQSLKWLAVVWGLMEILPGLIFFGCAPSGDRTFSGD